MFQMGVQLNLSSGNTLINIQEKVSLHDVSLHHRFFIMGGNTTPFWELSHDQRVSSHQSVPWRQFLLYIQ